MSVADHPRRDGPGAGEGAFAIPMEREAGGDEGGSGIQLGGVHRGDGEAVGKEGEEAVVVDL